MSKAKTTTTTPTVNTGKGALPATTDKCNRRVPSEPAYTYTERSPRETHRINGDGSSTRR